MASWLPSSCCCLLLYALLLSLWTNSYKGINAKNIIEEETKTNHLHVHPSTQIDDPSLNVFFTLNDLQVGNTFPIYFSIKDPSKTPQILPREQVDLIPFSLSHLPELIDFFSFPKHSPQAKAMEYTLGECEMDPLKGEAKFSATSLESMLDSTRGVFGSETLFKCLITTHLSKHTSTLQNYTVLEVPKVIETSKMVACHTMPYPYAVFYCHGQESDHKVFQIMLGGENGEKVEAVGVCHMDTSQWDGAHVAFHVLKTTPGKSPVCHFFPADNLVWVASPSVKSLSVIV